MASQRKNRHRESQAMFRRWLIERLIATGFAGHEYSDDHAEAVALELGIQQDVLIEARLDALEARVTGKRHAVSGQKRAGSLHYQYQLEFPEQLWPLWQNEASRAGSRGVPCCGLSSMPTS